MMQYEQDTDGKLPPFKLPPMKDAAQVEQVLLPYAKQDALFQHPLTHAPYQPNTSLSRQALSGFAEPATMVLYYEADQAPDGTRAVLFLDGHVRRVDPAEWRRLKIASHVPNPHQGVRHRPAARGTMTLWHKRQ